MVETAGLENLCTARYRGFESLPLRVAMRAVSYWETAFLSAFLDGIGENLLKFVKTD